MFLGRRQLEIPCRWNRVFPGIYGKALVSPFGSFEVLRQKGHGLHFRGKQTKSRL
jgi:hypothetical protein